MSDLSYMEKLFDGVEVEWKVLEDVFDILVGGDVPKNALSDTETEEFNIPILSNGIDDRSLYGWTNKAKVVRPSITISARGTIGWTSYRDKPIFPIVRLLVLTSKIELNLKYAYHYMKAIENNYNVPKNGIPQLTKPMVKDIVIPIPPLNIQAEIVRILDTFTELTAELTAELVARKQQYIYYRNQLMNIDVNSAAVKQMSLGEIYHFQYGKGNTIPKTGGEYPVYGSNGVVGSHDQYNSEDAPVIGHIGAYAGIVNWGKGKHFVTYNGVICRIKSEEVLSQYAYYLLLLQNFGEKSNSASQPFVSYHILEAPVVPIPSLAEQERIVAILDKFNTLTTSLTEGLPREIELRQQQYEYYRELLLRFPKAEVANHD